MKIKPVLYGLTVLSIILVIGSVIGGRATGSEYFYLSFLVGWIIFLDVATFIIRKHSLFSHLKKTWKHVLLLFGLGLLAGVFVFDLPALYVFQVWEYPTTKSLLKYLFLIAPMWASFFIIFYQSYELLHIALRGKHDKFGLYPHKKSTAKKLFSYIGISGLASFIISIVLLFFNINKVMASICAAIGVWLILESVEFQTTKRTFLVDLLQGDVKPLANILIGAFVIGLITEFMNLPIGLWIYKNVPWSNSQIAGVPWIVLISWIWLYIIFLSLYKIIYHGDRDLWA